MKLILDIPEKWFDDMVREEFTEVDELCALIQHSAVISGNYSNTTNGEVLNLLFPNITRTGTILSDKRENVIATNVNLYWWNDKYMQNTRLE